MHRFEIPNPVRPQPSAKFLERIPNPNQSHRLQRPPTENHSSEAIIGGVETAAGAFALVLESDAPIVALDASAIGFDADRAEQIEPAFSGLKFAGVYATAYVHMVQRYAKLCKTMQSSPKTNIVSVPISRPSCALSVIPLKVES